MRGLKSKIGHDSTWAVVVSSDELNLLYQENDLVVFNEQEMGTKFSKIMSDIMDNKNTIVVTKDIKVIAQEFDTCITEGDLIALIQQAIT